MAGRPVTAAVREIKNADGSLSLFVRMDDGTFARAETVRQFDYEVLRLSGDGNTQRNRYGSLPGCGAARRSRLCSATGGRTDRPCRRSQ
jgi:hypothetical protein